MVKIKPFYVLVGSKTKAKVNFPQAYTCAARRRLVDFAPLWLVAFNPSFTQNPLH